MDSKATFHVVKFLMAATKLNKQDARRMLEEVPEDRYSKLFIGALGWERDTEGKASQILSEVLGDQSLATLTEATRLAKIPSHLTGKSDGHNNNKTTKKRPRR